MTSYRPSFQQLLQLTLLFTAVLLVIYRLQVLREFAWFYPDSDQGIMWLGARDYSEGQFHTFHFYGQDYNTMLESLLAVPLLWAGVHVHKALPVITTLLSLLPFFMMSFLLYRYHRSAWSVVILAFPLFLPVEYDLTTSISRGFVTGLAVFSLSFPVLFNLGNKAYWFLCGLLALLSYSVNPNSLIISSAIIFYLWLENYRKPEFYGIGIAGILCGLFLHFALLYSSIPPDGNILHQYDLSVSGEFLRNGLKHAEDFYVTFVPFAWWSTSWLLWIWLLLCLIFALKRMYSQFILCLCLPLLILLPLAVSKVHDGTASVYFPVARMFLALPLLICLLLLFFRSRSKKILLFFGLLAAVFFILKWNLLKEKVDQAVQEENNHIVAVMEIGELRTDCGFIIQLAEKYQAEVLIVNNHWYQDFYAYACPALSENMIPTLRPDYERRYWQWEELGESKFNRIFIVNTDPQFGISHPYLKQIKEKEGFYLYTPEGENLQEILNKLDQP